MERNQIFALIFIVLLQGQVFSDPIIGGLTSLGGVTKTAGSGAGDNAAGMLGMLGGEGGGKESGPLSAVTSLVKQVGALLAVLGPVLSVLNMTKSLFETAGLGDLLCDDGCGGLELCIDLPPALTLNLSLCPPKGASTPAPVETTTMPDWEQPNAQ